MSTPTRDAVLQLSRDEYAVAWEHLGLGLRHWNLDLPGGPVRTVEVKTLEDERAWDGLRRRDLARGRDLAPQLEDGLHLLASAPVEINGTVDTSDGRVRVVGVSRDTVGVVAELYPEGLRLRSTRGAPLPSAVIAPLPEHPPVPGTGVSVPSEALPARTGPAGEDVEQVLLRGGVRREDAGRFRAVVRGSRLLGARFGAARRDRRGARHTAGTALAYLVTEQGGYTVEERRGVDGRSWTTVAPSGKADLAQRLERLLASVRT